MRRVGETHSRRRVQSCDEHCQGLFRGVHGGKDTDFGVVALSPFEKSSIQAEIV